MARSPARRPRRRDRNAAPRVLLLAVALLTLMAVVVGLGTFELARLRADFESLSRGAYPGFDLLLHIDRDLLAAQRALEVAALQEDPTAAAASLQEYHLQVARTDERWQRYLAIPDQSAAEVTRHADYEQARNAWLDTTERLTAAILLHAQGGPLPTDLLAQSRIEFDTMRTVVHDLEDDVYEPRIAVAVAAVEGHTRTTRNELLALLALGLGIGGLASRAAVRSTRLLDRERNRNARTQAFDAALDTALDMALDEPAVLATVALVLEERLPDHAVELLLADSSHAHLARMLRTGEADPNPGCDVGTPMECPAIRRGTRIVFPDSTEFSACPHLRDREAPPCAAACTPVSVGGRAVGVLHAIGPRGLPFPDDALRVLGQVATKAGDRIGVIRAFSTSRLQASTDPLTGLMNRRSFENAARQVLAGHDVVTVVFADLDHFKELNDRHGHDTGDRALRLFARAVRRVLRAEDLVARWGGEEFVILLPDLDTEAAESVVQRIREQLVLETRGGSAPSFTCSFGVTDSRAGGDLETLVGQADAALLEAKRRGRNRAVRWTTELGAATATARSSTVPET